MKRYFYKIYGIHLKVLTNSSVIASVIDLFLGHCESYSESQSSDSSTRDIEFVFKEVKNKTDIPLQVSPSFQTISSSHGAFWSCSFYRLMNLEIADFGKDGMMFIDYQQRKVEGYLVKPNEENPAVLAQFVFIALTELLKIKNIYGIHAAAIEKDGYGFLIPAPSGSGKTTCLVSLIRSGYHFISDDHVFLTEKNEDFEILPSFLRQDDRLFLEFFFKEIHQKTGISTLNATEKTIKLFPELTQNKGYPYSNGQKRYFFVDEVYPGNSVSFCKPHFIIFPKIVDYSKSYLEPLAKTKALEEILPEGLFVVDQETAKKQFRTFSSLIEKSECYRLYFGDNFLDIPNLFDTLISTK